MKTYTKEEVFRTAFKYVESPLNSKELEASFGSGLLHGINQVCPCCKAGSLNINNTVRGFVEKIIDPVELRPWSDFYTTFKFAAYKCSSCGYMWSWYQSPPLTAYRNKVSAQIITSPDRREMHAACMQSISSQKIDIATYTKGPHLDTRFEFIKECKTRYLMFIDDDDLLAPNIFNMASLLLEDNPTSFLGVHSDEASFTNNPHDLCDTSIGYTQLPAAKPLDRELIVPSYHLNRVRILSTYWAQQAMLEIQKETSALQALIYPEYSIYMVARILSGLDWKHLPTVGYYWRQHAGNIHRNKDQNQAMQATKNMMLRIAARKGII